jgi:hypothetical protein
MSESASSSVISPGAAPSSALLHAAFAGMLALATGCGDDNNPAELVDAGDVAEDAGGNEKDAATPDEVDAGDDEADGGSAVPDAAIAADAGSTSGWVDPETKKIGEPENKIYSYAALEERCVEAGGYVQIHAACAGNNFCAGFSYGDWGDGSQLQEHSCAGVNGCNGISCVYMAKGEGRTGKEIYEDLEPPPGAPIACTGCHTGFNEDDLSANLTKFKVFVKPGETRASDFSDISELQQQSIVAFGKTTFTAEGHALANMAGYWKLLSREEIIAVVKYIREELTPQVYEYRVGDQ